MPLPARKAADEVCVGCAHLLLWRAVADEVVKSISAVAQVGGVVGRPPCMLDQPDGRLASAPWLQQQFLEEPAGVVM